MTNILKLSKYYLSWGVVVVRGSLTETVWTIILKKSTSIYRLTKSMVNALLTSTCDHVLIMYITIENKWKGSTYR